MEQAKQADKQAIFLLSVLAGLCLPLSYLVQRPNTLLAQRPNNMAHLRHTLFFILAGLRPIIF